MTVMSEVYVCNLGALALAFRTIMACGLILELKGTLFAQVRWHRFVGWTCVSFTRVSPICNDDCNAKIFTLLKIDLIFGWAVFTRFQPRASDTLFKAVVVIHHPFWILR